MKLIIAGSRNLNITSNDISLVLHDYLIPYENLEIVSGAAKGPDSEAIKFATANLLPVHIFPAQWQTYGKGAGSIRNRQMGDFADQLVAFWDGKSRGTQNMIDYMTYLNKPCIVIRHNGT